jgi:hypothetical protein
LPDPTVDVIAAVIFGAVLVRTFTAKLLDRLSRVANFRG